MTAQARDWRPRRILVGYDGSEGGHDAIALAKLLGEHGADFLLVDVIPPVGISSMRPRRLQDEEPPQSRGFFLEALRDLSGSVAETRTYVANSAAHVLSEIAEHEDFDLIVIGPAYPGAIGRVLLGSVGTSLMHDGAAPVVAAPRGYAARVGDESGPVAVAFDASPEALEALAYAEVLARQMSSSLRLLYVAPPAPGIAVRAEGLTRPAPEMILADGFAAVAPDLPIEGSALEGRSVAATIAEECAADVRLLVVGSRGYGMLGRVVIGSVATGLLHRARCPVLTVPRPRTPVDDQGVRGESAAAAG